MNETHHIFLLGEMTGWQWAGICFAVAVVWSLGRATSKLDEVIRLLRLAFRERFGRWPD
jgi:hypothetical protein